MQVRDAVESRSTKESNNRWRSAEAAKAKGQVQASRRSRQTGAGLDLVEPNRILAPGESHRP